MNYLWGLQQRAQHPPLLGVGVMLCDDEKARQLYVRQQAAVKAAAQKLHMNEDQVRLVATVYMQEMRKED